MTTLLLIIMLLSGAILSLCVLLMSPKGGLGFGIGGVTSGNEYGTSKTVESRLKSIVTVTGIIFIVSAIFYPYSKPVNQTKLDGILNGGVINSGAESAIDNLNLGNTINTPDTNDIQQPDQEDVNINLDELNLQPDTTSIQNN